MRRIIDTVNLLLGYLAGIFLVCLCLRPDTLIAFLQYLSQTSVAVLLLFLGLAVLVGNLRLAWREFRSGGSRRNLEVTTDEGVNILSIHALEQQLLAEVQKSPDVIEPAVAMAARGEGLPLACRIDFKLKRQENVMRRADEIKKRAREAFFRLIPSGAAIEITANVRDLVGEGDVLPAKMESEFFGPKYPVEADEGA
ncbi:membrane protein [sediment metagenome]|uniref:Membrane protein n=1 Tax=sediment metagenome TaxID=749907 RepID=D9PKA7_9ZZZZ